MAQNRLPFEIDVEIERGVLTAHAGVPMLIELFQASGAAAVVEERVSTKSRKRGLSAAQMLESLFALWAAGGERAEDLDRLREDAGLAVLLGHGLPAAQTARDFLEQFDADGLPLLQAGPKAQVPAESANLQGLAAANRAILAELQRRRPQRVATLDVDATVIPCTKRAAKPTYDGQRGYQPVVALWAEQDAVLAEEFRDGNVPAGSGNRRVVEAAVAALPPGVERMLLRGDSALYEHELLRWLEARGIGYGISADMSRELRAAISALPEAAWGFESEDGEVVRHWAEVTFVPDDHLFRRDRPPPPRYLALRISKKQGRLFADGAEVKHFAIVTNLPDPEGGSGLDLIRWQRGKAGTIEHVHDVLTNDLAAAALPSQKFGANAAWLRANAMLYNLMTLFKVIGLPEDLRAARPKRLRFLVLNIVGKVVRHARQLLLRCTCAFARLLLDRFRVALHALLPALAGE